MRRPLRADAETFAFPPTSQDSKPVGGVVVVPSPLAPSPLGPSARFDVGYCSAHLRCSNCGIEGHSSKRCNQPVTSFGVVLSWLPRDDCERTYLVVQRRDSYAYVEFLRGKYDVRNRQYIVDLFGSMTASERSAILSHSFQKLWDNLWGGCSLTSAVACEPLTVTSDAPHSSAASHQQAYADVTKYGNRIEFFEARTKFRRLQKGVRMRTCDGDAIVLDMRYAAEMGTLAPSSNVVPEWGFPKGRRNRSGETGLECALRELFEETGIDRSRINVLPGKPFEEVFTGSNGVRYKHVYFMASVADDTGQNRGHRYQQSPLRVSTKKPDIVICQRELRAAGFFDRDTITCLFRGSKERQELFKRLSRIADEAKNINKIEGSS